MSEQNLPKICSKKPELMDMKPGTYWWCSCGLSKNQPFCDGSHKGTGFSPVGHEVTEDSKVAWCMCKNSNSGAICDGSHGKI